MCTSGIKKAPDLLQEASLIFVVNSLSFQQSHYQVISKRKVEIIKFTAFLLNLIVPNSSLVLFICLLVQIGCHLCVIIKTNLVKTPSLLDRIFTTIIESVFGE